MVEPKCMTKPRFSLALSPSSSLYLLVYVTKSAHHAHSAWAPLSAMYDNSSINNQHQNYCAKKSQFYQNANQPTSKRSKSSERACANIADRFSHFDWAQYILCMWHSKRNVNGTCDKTEKFMPHTKWEPPQFTWHSHAAPCHLPSSKLLV